MKRRVFPPLLCAIVLGVIPWRRFVSPFRFAVQYIVSSPSLKTFSPRGISLTGIDLIVWSMPTGKQLRRHTIAGTTGRGYRSLLAEADIQHHNCMSHGMDEREHLRTTSKRGHPTILGLSPNRYVNCSPKSTSGSASNPISGTHSLGWGKRE